MASRTVHPALRPYVDGPLGESVAHELAGLGCWTVRFDRLEEILLDRLARSTPPVTSPEVAQAWRLTLASGGTVRVGELAERVGWSRRRLLDRFCAEYGVGPKVAARIVRFEGAHRMLRAGASPAEVAHRCGYADQAHLGHEFTAMAAMTPGQASGPDYRVP